MTNSVEMQTTQDVSVQISAVLPVLKSLFHCGALWVTGAGAAAESTSQVEHGPSTHTRASHTNSISFTAIYCSYFNPLPCLDNSLWTQVAELMEVRQIAVVHN